MLVQRTFKKCHFGCRCACGLWLCTCLVPILKFGHSAFTSQSSGFRVQYDLVTFWRTCTSFVAAALSCSCRCVESSTYDVLMCVPVCMSVWMACSCLCGIPGQRNKSKQPTPHRWMTTLCYLFTFVMSIDFGFGAFLRFWFSLPREDITVSLFCVTTTLLWKFHNAILITCCPGVQSHFYRCRFDCSGGCRRCIRDTFPGRCVSKIPCRNLGWAVFSTAPNCDPHHYGGAISDFDSIPSQIRIPRTILCLWKACGHHWRITGPWIMSCSTLPYERCQSHNCGKYR